MRRFAYLLLFVAGCGTPAPVGNDSGVTVHDMSMGGTDGGALPDLTMGATNTGTMLVSGKAFQLQAMTDDDYIVMNQFKTSSMVVTSVAPIDGSKMPVNIATNYGGFTISGKSVIVWENVDSGTLIGDLSIWNAAGGLKSIQMGTALVVDTRVSDDQQTLFYVQTHDGAGMTGDAFVSKIDGTSPVKVASVIQSTQAMGDCIPFSLAAGTGFVHVYCDGNAGDGGTLTMNATVDAVTANGTVTNILKGAKQFAAMNKDHTKVLVADAAGNAQVFPAAGGSGTAVAPKFVNGYFLPDDSVVMVNTDMALQHVVPGMAPTVLDAMNGGNFFPPNPGGIQLSNTVCPVSPDGKYVTYFKAADTNGISDVNLAPTAGGAPQQVLKTQSGLVFGDVFTQDSSRFIYYTDVKTVPIAGNAIGLVGSLFSTPVAGGMAVTHATGVWVSYSTSKPGGISYNDNFAGATGSNNGRADLKVITDSSKTDPPSVIATKAEADYFPNHDRSKLVYATHATGAEGVYVAPIP
jgi:hypothetical protein